VVDPLTVKSRSTSPMAAFNFNMAWGDAVIGPKASKYRLKPIGTGRLHALPIGCRATV
jgi:hypothetical protein